MTSFFLNISYFSDSPKLNLCSPKEKIGLKMKFIVFNDKKYLPDLDSKNGHNRERRNSGG
jgi:hypothetical protein